LDQKKLDQQSQHWEASFLSKPEMFGLEPSIAAIKALKLFQKENAAIIVTADGPKGPRKIAKEGSIKLAKKHNVPIVAASAISSSYWELPSWDQTKIPKPFSTIYVKFDEHYFNNDQINSQNISKYIEDNQNQLTKEIEKNI